VISNPSGSALYSGAARFSITSLALRRGESPRKSANLFGHDHLHIVPGIIHVPFLVERYPLGAKSSDPPKPFWVRDSMTCVEFTFP